MLKQALRLDSPCTVLKGVGDRIAEKLAHLHIHTLNDLLFHLPLRYEDRTQILPIAQTTLGHSTQIEGTITKIENRFGETRSIAVELEDETGSIELRFFHFSPPQIQQLKRPHIRLRCYGEIRRIGKNRGMIHPEYQIITESSPPPPSEQLTPFYPTTAGLPQTIWRKIMPQLFALLPDLANSLVEYLPSEQLKKGHYPSLVEALKILHFPSNHEKSDLVSAIQHPARQRLILEELVAHQLSLQRIKHKAHQEKAYSLPKENALVSAFLQKLPFSLTGAQQRVMTEVLEDLNKNHPMLRLVQGDVGSGKTIVAAIALLQAVACGYQGALMAPTELLAEQHFKNLKSWFEPLGIRLAWLTGSQKSSEREIAMNAISTGEAQIIVGTHALFQNNISFSSLALVVIDEQHRFGVHQRLALRNKGISGHYFPHQLVMTATPIPRTLAMTVYADLDYSVIDELPPGRTPITTVNIPNSRRDEVIERIRVNCAQGKQAYWVCTLIEESEVLQCEAAEQVWHRLRDALPELCIGLIHGRLKQNEKDEMMQLFKDGQMALLVATTVIEVGVDVPNASLMIIENPERLGLAQLHQLRGRVGRGDTLSYCVLLYQNPLTQLAQERLATLRETHDGFIIAQKDLALRGPGEVLGTRQTGLLTLKIADLQRDAELLPLVRDIASDILSKNPEAIEPVIARWIGSQENYLKV